MLEGDDMFKYHLLLFRVLPSHTSNEEVHPRCAGFQYRRRKQNAGAANLRLVLLLFVSNAKALFANSFLMPGLNRAVS